MALIKPVRVDIKQVRSVVEGPLYRVVTSVTFASNISASIFVFSVGTDAFSHVATVWDMEHVRADKVVATAYAELYYRASSVTVDYDDPETAQTAADYTKSRVETLVLLYEQATNDFVGTDTESYVEPS